MAPTATASSKRIKALANNRNREYIKLNDAEIKQNEEFIKANPNTFNAKFFQKALTRHCDMLGLKSLFNQMSHTQLTTLYTTFEEPTKKQNKMFLSKFLWRSIMVNINDYFKGLEAEEVEIFNEFLNSVPKKGEFKSEDATEEVRMIGVEIFLYDLPSELLKKQLEEENYDLAYFTVQNPNDFVYTLLTGEYPVKKAPKKKVEILFVQKKPSLSKAGNRYHDIFQHYHLSELQEFVRETKVLKISGTKHQLVNRILKYVNDDIIEGPKERVKKEVEVEEEEEEEEEEVEEVEEEEDEEIDLQPTPDPIPEKSPSNKKGNAKQTNTIVGKSPKKSTPNKSK